MPFDVADDAAKIGLELAQAPVGALELMRMGVALMLDQCQLADPPIGLAQPHPKLLSQAHQPLACPVQQLGVGREHHRLRLHCGVDHNTGEVGRLHRLRPARHCQALLQQRRKFLVAHPLTPTRQRGAVEHQRMSEKLLAAEVLEVRVLHPAIAQTLVGKVVGMLEDRQPCHQPRRQRRLARLVRVDRPEPLLQKTPIDRLRQLHQRVVHIDDLVKPRAKQILLATLPPLAWSHRKSPAPSARARRITAYDSRESSNQICKEIAFQRSKTGKFDYLSAPNQPAHSMAFEFFTDDAI